MNISKQKQIKHMREKELDLHFKLIMKVLEMSKAGTLVAGAIVPNEKG